MSVLCINVTVNRGFSPQHWRSCQVRGKIAITVQKTF